LARHLSEAAEIIGDVRLYEQGESAASEALELDPKGPFAPEARTTRGLIRLERGENEKALESFRAVLAEYPAYAPAHAGLAYLFKNTGLWERSLLEQAEASRIDPSRAHSIPRLSVLIYQDRFEEAHQEIDALLKTRPRYSHYNYWKGIVYFYEGEAGNSREWILRGYEMDPDNAIARGVLAFSLAHAGDRTGAEKLLASAEPGAPADGTFTYWLAKARAALGDVAGAIAWIGRAEALGYWNAPWIARDRALVSLHVSPAFLSRLESVREKHERFRRLAEG
jgi:tetratricopeptide (TPR) repeat protein